MTEKIGSTQESKEEKWGKIASHNSREIKGFFGDFRFLSNFWPAKVFLDGEEYNCIENAYQAAKYKKESRSYFLGCSPGEAIAFVKENNEGKYPAEEWDKKKLEIMRSLLTQKFDKDLNPENYEKLLETKEKYLEETNYWGDIYWGVSKNNGEEEGVGENNLGKLLMAIRESEGSLLESS